jgi:molybdenum cofactor guanylyltransferase
MPPEDIAGAVLAGGASRRFGSDKAVASLGGQTLLERAVSVVATAGCDPVLIVGGEQRHRNIENTIYVPDLYAGEGPLGGLLSALAVSGTDWTLLVACDLPSLTPELLRILIEARGSHDVVLAAGSRGCEPLIGIYRRSVESRFAEAFQAGTRALHGALKLVDVGLVTVPDEKILRNVNRVEDL